MSDPTRHQPGEPISKLLRGITDAEVRELHLIDDDIRAFEGSAWRSTALLHVGGESVVLELIDGMILKMTGKRKLEQDMGRRPFDCPILGRRCWFHIQWFTQPKAVTPVSIQERDRFREEIKQYGYEMHDAYPENLGRYRGRVCLLDPWAVSSPRGYA